MPLSELTLWERNSRTATAARWRCGGLRRGRRELVSWSALAFSVALYGFDAFVPAVAQTDPKSAVSANLHVVFDDGLLTVDASDVALQDLLEAIAAETGLGLSTPGSLGDRMTISFVKLGLTDAIDRLLNGRSYALQYTADSPSVPSRLWVMSVRDLRQEGDYRDADRGFERSGQEQFATASRERLEAVAALAERETATFAFEIAPALGDESDAVRYEAVHVLGEAGGDTSTGLLHQLLYDPDAGIRAAAIDALAEAGGELSAVTLATALRDPDPALRENAVYALGEIGGERALELLDQAVTDPDEWVRQAADDVLSELATED